MHSSKDMLHGPHVKNLHVTQSNTFDLILAFDKPFHSLITLVRLKGHR